MCPCNENFFSNGDIVIRSDGTNAILIDQNGSENLISVPSWQATWQQPSGTCISCSSLDPEEALRRALECHESDGTTEICESGMAHFFPNGSVAVQCRLPCNNSLYLVANGSDVVDSCDIAIKKLEEMKKSIEKMQEKVFELSLQQRRNDD